MRYFFDIVGADGRTRDDTGLEFADDATARREAIRTMGELARDHLVGPEQSVYLWVRKDGQTLEILTLHFNVVPARL